MNRIRGGKFGVAIAALLCLVIAGRADVTVPQKAEDVNPIKIGSGIPKIVLQTTEGKAFDLNMSIMRKPTVLIYYRGGWCPYCSRQLGQLQTIEPQLLKLGYQVVAVSSDSPMELRKTLAKTPLTYTLLSDASMRTAQTLGIAWRVDDATYAKYKDYGIDLEKTSGFKHHLLPVPSVFVLGKDGTIHFSYVNPNYAVRLSPKVLLAAAEAALPEPAEAVKDEH